MSTNRRETEITTINFEEFLTRSLSQPVVRVQGKQESPTKQRGRLVRFNRLVFIEVPTARVGNSTGVPYVRARRMIKRHGSWVPEGDLMTVSFRLLDYVAWDGGISPDWIKISD